MKLNNGCYMRPHSRYRWWQAQGTYWRYMIRELSSLFIGLSSFIFIVGLYRLSQGAIQFESWQQSLWSLLLVPSIISFGFAVYHSLSWFMVTPKAMPIVINRNRVPAWIIIAVHLSLWLVCSAALYIAVVFGGI